MKVLICLTTILVFGFACTSVSTTKVGGKKIVHVSQIGLQFFNKGGAPVQECVKTLGKKGATRLITSSGAPTGGIFGLSRSVMTSGLDQCSAVGEK
jgi:hypothetical protein